MICPPLRRGCVAVTLLFAVIASACGGSSPEQASDSASTTVDSITVAAASNLRPAFEDIGDAFTKDSGIEVTFSFGASGQLSTQLQNGAPFDVFAPADSSFIEDVVTAGAADEQTRRDYAVGRIVMVPAQGQPMPTTLADLTNTEYTTIAIANPQLAPYGTAAKQAIENSGLWTELQPRVVYGQNIAATLEIANTGNAQVAIAALSLVISQNLPYTLIDSDLHDPLVQSIVVTTTGSRTTESQDFVDFLGSPVAQNILASYGFTSP